MPRAHKSDAPGSSAGLIVGVTLGSALIHDAIIAHVCPNPPSPWLQLWHGTHPPFYPTLSYINQYGYSPYFEPKTLSVLLVVETDEGATFIIHGTTMNHTALKEGS